ncbi:MAG TPA: hypothetical protein VMZ50_13435 [Phycisphaerae bacterium]|nr:hypothetical protein [Phycisphaerae bacterium]
MRTLHSDIWGSLVGDVLFKGGTSEGAKRGWKTRKKMMGAVKPEEGEGRKKKAEEGAGAKRGKIGLEWLPGEKPAKPAEEKPRGRGGIGLEWLKPAKPAEAEAPAKPPKKARKPRKPKADVAEGPPLSRPPGPAQKSVRASVETMRRAAQDGGKSIRDKRLADKQGVGETYRVTFADGTMAAYKPTAGTAFERMKADAGGAYDGDIPEAVREVGIHALSEAAGFNVVPHIELGDFGGGDGHVMAWVDGKMGEEIGRDAIDNDVEKGHPDLHRIVALDLITDNSDRHGGNFIKGEDGRYYAIDNGFAFPKVVIGHPGGLGRRVAGRPIPAEVAEGVKRLKPALVRERMLKAGLGEPEVRAAVKRLNVVLGAVKAGRWPDWDELRRQLARARRR